MRMQEAKKIFIPALVLLILSFTALPATSGAQTIFSPGPILTIHEYAVPGFEIAVQSTPEVKGSTEPAEEKVFQIPVILNDRVESQIEFFTTRGRSVFQSWLDRSARYLPIMKKIFRDFNLPEDLVYVAMIESGFNLHAVSPKKAVGPWQFLKATAREYGLNTDRWVDERRDPIKSTRAAAAHFKDLYNLFGSWPLALASYNAGMGRMQGAVQKARTADFWELSASNILHAETREYVPRYLAAMIIAKNAPDYGFIDRGAGPIEFDEIVVPPGTDLRRLADYCGKTVKEIRDLNPELLQFTTPQKRYVLRLPAGTRALYQRRLTKATNDDRRRVEERNTARKGGLLFSKLTDTDPLPPPERADRSFLVSPYGAQLSSAMDILGPTLPASGSLKE